MSIERPQADRYDVVIAGGGHNGLVAAAYLAGAGYTVAVCEAGANFGGATQSAAVFAGQDARLSRYAYLVSLLPDRIVADLGLRLECRSRTVASYTPVLGPTGADGVLIGRGGHHTLQSVASMDRICGTGSHAKYEAFTSRLERLAGRLAPTMLGPLASASTLRDQSGDKELWDALTRRPIGEWIRAHFPDDLLAGIVGTDGVIGTFASLEDVSLAANRCFLYHIIGNGTGEWRVPVGGMGALITELLEVCAARGVELVTCAAVTGVEADGHTAEVTLAGGARIAADWVLWGAPPSALARAKGQVAISSGSSSLAAEGSQMKLNMLLTRLPRLASGMDPQVAFAGTLHVGESYHQLETAYADAAAGLIPATLPFELYCHTLTDPTILGPDLATAGYHTVTLFGMHTPATLFDGDGVNVRLRDELTARYLAALNVHLAEPIEDCLAIDSDGRPCLEAHTPLDLEDELGMARGNIFHAPLTFPVADSDLTVGSWGVETPDANILICGAAARRGGGVSGIPGQNAAMAVLARSVQFNR